MVQNHPKKGKSFSIIIFLFEMIGEQWSNTDDCSIKKNFKIVGREKKV
jgi:hypothetical protein